MQIQSSFHRDDTQGCLYLVPTPIGNLEDITYRAVRMLSEVDLILAEDTRNSGHLLKHFEISTPMQSFHDFSTDADIDKYIQRLQQGQTMALISDAGMPLINDPGHPLVTRAISENIAIIALPGANAALTALIASGLVSDRFTYLGFFPRKQQEQETLLKWIGLSRGTMIFYESPHRIAKTIDHMAEILPDTTRVVIARELTKKFEEYLRGTIKEIQLYLTESTPKGEMVLLIEAGSLIEIQQEELTVEAMKQLVDEWIEREGVTPMKAIKAVAKQFQLKKQEVYDAYHELT